MGTGEPMRGEVSVKPIQRGLVGAGIADVRVVCGILIADTLDLELCVLFFQTAVLIIQRV